MSEEKEKKSYMLMPRHVSLKRAGYGMFSATVTCPDCRQRTRAGWDGGTGLWHFSCACGFNGKVIDPDAQGEWLSRLGEDSIQMILAGRIVNDALDAGIIARAAVFAKMREEPPQTRQGVILAIDEGRLPGFRLGTGHYAIVQDVADLGEIMAAAQILQKALGDGRIITTDKAAEIAGITVQGIVKGAQRGTFPTIILDRSLRYRNYLVIREGLQYYTE